MNTRTIEDLTDDEWRRILQRAAAIRRRIVEAGGMATKTAVEDELMPEFGVDRYTAHHALNTIERENLR